LNRQIGVYQNWELGSYARGTETAYDGAGNMRSVTTGLSTHLQEQVSVTSYAYDVLHRRTDTYQAWNTPYQVHTHTIYDAADNPILVTTGIGDGPGAKAGYGHETTTLNTYDALHRLVMTATGVGTSDHPMPQLTGYVYDAADNTIQVIQYSSTDSNPDPNQRQRVITHYQYDAFHHPVTIDQAWNSLSTGWTANFQSSSLRFYDTAGNLVESDTGYVSGPANPLVTKYAYDALNRQTRVDADPGAADEHLTTMAYDAADNLLSQTDPGPADFPRVTTSYAYDA